MKTILSGIFLFFLVGCTAQINTFIQQGETNLIINTKDENGTTTIRATSTGSTRSKDKTKKTSQNIRGVYKSKGISQEKP